MPHMVAALFEDYATAENALRALMEAGVALDRIAVIGDSDGREVSSISGFRELSARDDTLAELHDLPLPDDDLRLFEQGLLRGHALIAARVDRSNLDEAIRIIGMFDPLDLDRKSKEWAGESGGRIDDGVNTGGSLAAGRIGGVGAGLTDTAELPGSREVAEGTDDLGTDDLRIAEASTNDGGLSETATGGRRAEERAGRPGILEMDQRSDASVAPKMAPGTGGVASARGNAKPDLLHRDTTRMGRVRAYGRE